MAWSGSAQLLWVILEFYLNTSGITNLDSQITVDLEGGYFITDNIEVSVGAQNAFASEPTTAFTADAFGNTFPVASPAGFSGGYYYARVAFDFGN